MQSMWSEDTLPGWRDAGRSRGEQHGGIQGEGDRAIMHGAGKALQGAYIEDADIVVNEVFHHLDLMLPFSIGLEEAGCEEK